MSLFSGKLGGLWRRLAWIIAFGLAGAVIALFLVLAQAPLYEAHGSIELGAECAGPAAIPSEAFLETEMELLRSDTLHASAVRSAHVSAAFPRPEVTREGLSRVIHIRALAAKPQLAADYVNALINGYIADHSARLTALSGTAAEQMNDAIVALKDAEKRLQSFARRNGMPVLANSGDLALLEQDSRAQYSALSGVVEEKRKARDEIAAHMQGAAEAAASGVHIVDRAQPPELPIGRNRKLKVLTGLVLGSLLGLLVSLAMPRSGSEGPFALDLRGSGYWPSKRSFDYSYEDRPGRAGEDLAAVPEPTAPAAPDTRSERQAQSTDALQTWDDLVANLRQLLNERDHQLIAVASASADPIYPEMPILLAEALAESETAGKVLVIDCDISGSVTDAVGLTPGTGLSDYMLAPVRKASVDDSPVRATNRAGVFVMANGTMPYRLPSMIMKLPGREVFASLLAEYRCVLLSAPPVLSSREMSNLATIVDGVVLVVPGELANGLAAAEVAASARVKVQEWGGRVLGAAEETIL